MGHHTEISKIMTRAVAQVESSETLEKAYIIMRELQISYLPVMVRQILVGVLAKQDVMLHATKQDGHMFIPNLPVIEMMRRNVPIVPPSCNIKKAAEILLSQELQCLLVMSEDQLVGIVTSSDFLKFIANGSESELLQAGTSELYKFAYYVPRKIPNAI